MRVLLLGANGLLGHNVMVKLRERGHEVRILVRSEAFARESERMAECRLGTFTDISILEEAARGCEAIVNCTGATDMSMLRYEDYLPINRDSIATILEVMERQGIGRLVHVSTANTIGYGSENEWADESKEMEEPFASSYYARSKKEGEELVMEAAKRHGDWHVVVVNPGFMIGAYDGKPSSGQLLLAGYRKPLMAAPRGGKSFVHVGDVATAIVNGLTMGRNGERYLATGREMTLKEFYGMESRVCGYRQRFVTLPDWMVHVAGGMGDVVRGMGVKSQLSRRNANQLLVREYYNNGKATEELGMPQTPIERAIEDFFGWYGERKR